MSRREPAASPFRDLSNLRTPRPSPNPAASPLFFTASKAPLQGPTPTPLRRRGTVAGARAPTPTPLGRRLRTLEADQSRSARRAESGRERALHAFAASASSWLSLLLRDPAACGCSPAACSVAAQPCAPGKRDTLDGERARERNPKRRRGVDRGGERRKGMTPAMTAALRDSLRDACSLYDVTERMGRYMSKDACEEVLVMMCQICKNIDEGRLKMKAHCPLVTDLRLKDKATRIFLCYNPEWLRIGLHIVLGGDSLLQNGSGKRDKEVPFLKLILEKQFFAQIMTAKTFAHKKAVEGLNRQGYSEALGNIILKRTFLLVAALDKAKVESALPLENGIDGLDGGSPLLFCRQDKIKSSRQIIQESLGEAMHGEGDLLIHLTTMGYKLGYQQPALSEYDFTIRSLFEDLQDGIILCRVVQLLVSDASIILKVIAPSDTHKKKLHNCTIVVQSIKQAGVPLTDSDGVTISAEDIATGDKELILSLLWNVFIHMQLPLLANTTSLSRELSRLQVPVADQLMSEKKSHIGLLYDWVQVICSKYGMSFESSSQFDRGALNCLINYYLNIDTFPLKEALVGCQKELFTCHEHDIITDVTSCPTSKRRKVFADFLQDIPAIGILADDVLFDEKSAILLLAFLSSHLTNDKLLDQLKNLINTRLDYQSPETKISARRRSRGKYDMKHQFPQTENKDGSYTNQEWAATIIQTQARSMLANNKYCKRRKAAFILQGAIRAWSAVKRNRRCTVSTSTPWPAHGNRYFQFIIERHRFVQMRKSAFTIQWALRIWIKGRKRHESNEPFARHEFSETTTTNCIDPAPREQCSGEDNNLASATPSQHCKHVDTLRASAVPNLLCFDGIGCPDSATPLQLSDKRNNSELSAIQLCKSGHNSIPSPSPLLSMFESSCISTSSCQPYEVEASKVVSASSLVCEDDVDCGNDISLDFFQHEQPVSTWCDFPVSKEVVAAQRIQAAYRRFLHSKNLRVIAVIKIQSHWRASSVHKLFMRQVQAIIAIQTSARLFLCHQAFQRNRFAAILIQRVVRGWLARKRLLGSSSLQTYTRLCIFDQHQHKKCHQSLELKIALHSILRLQRWWRKFLLHQSIRTSVISIQSYVRGWLARKQLHQICCCVAIIQRWWRKVLFLESRKRAVIVIQAHFRGWMARQVAIRNRKCITTIQAYFKAYLVRKASKQEVAHEKSSAQVDDGMRLINRLLAAQSQLVHCSSISSIRQTCAILSTATEHSKNCCETLVAAGVIDKLLKQIHFLNRGIPDQEVLKLVLLTLRNIARYPHLRTVLVNTPTSVENVFQVLLRNKADGFFIASDILKKLCESEEGHETAQALQHHVKGLRSLLQQLEKKVEVDKRNGRTGPVKESNLRRRGEAATLYLLLTSDHRRGNVAE